MIKAARSSPPPSQGHHALSELSVKSAPLPLPDEAGSSRLPSILNSPPGDSTPRTHALHRKARSAPSIPLHQGIPMRGAKSELSSSTATTSSEYPANQAKRQRGLSSLQEFSLSGPRRPILHPLQESDRISMHSQSHSHSHSQSSHSRSPSQPQSHSYTRSNGSIRPFSQAPVPVIQSFCDREFRPLRFNEEAEELLGYSASQLRQMTLYDLVSKRDVPVLQAIYHRLFFEEMHSHGHQVKSVVSTIHPSYYLFAPPSMLMMAAPASMTYSVDVLLSQADGSFTPFKLLIYRSGAFCGATAQATSSREAQLYLCFTLVRAGYESRVQSRKEFQTPIVVDLTQDPTHFTNVAFLNSEEDVR